MSDATSIQANIPAPTAAIIGPTGQMNPAWYAFFRTLLFRTGGGSGESSGAIQAEVAVLKTEVTDVEAELASQQTQIGTIETELAAQQGEIAGQQFLIDGAYADGGRPGDADGKLRDLQAAQAALSRPADGRIATLEREVQYIRSLLAGGRHALPQETHADLLLPSGRRGTDFDAVTAELRKLILAIRPQRVPIATDLGLGSMAFQSAGAVAITGGSITGVASPQFTVGMALATTPFAWTGTNIGFDIGPVGTLGGSSSGAVVGANYYAGATNIYKTTAGASRLRVTTTLLSFDLAVSGTAGATATLVTQFQIDASGNVVNRFGTADQSYNYQTPTTGFAITIAAGVKTLLLDPAGTLATGTITLPAAPADGQEIRINSSQNVTALTVSPSAGQSVKNPPTSLTTNAGGPQGYQFIYRAANTTWYRTQ